MTTFLTRMQIDRTRERRRNIPEMFVHIVIRVRTFSSVIVSKFCQRPSVGIDKKLGKRVSVTQLPDTLSLYNFLGENRNIRNVSRKGKMLRRGLLTVNN